MQTRTFLFADLRDYTKFVEHHGDSAAATLIGDYRRLVRAEVARHEGAEVKTEGDSFYVVFTSAQAALRCGMAILREADRYSSERPDRPIKVGVGIHAGEPQPHEGQFVGSAVIVAARLAQQSAAGELLVTEVVRALLPHGPLPDMTERADLVLKGIDRAPRVFRVLRPAPEPSPAPTPGLRETAVSAAPPAGPVVAHDLIGRDAELRAMQDFLDEARSGAGKLVLVAGDAGLGKSALVRRVIELARNGGMTLMIGECSEIEARRPFGPVIDAFASSSLPLPEGFALSGPGAQATAEADRYIAHGAFAQRLRDLATKPLALIVEDVHWADSATLELLEYLPRQIRSFPILVVATYRSDELHRRHPLNATLGALERSRLVAEVRLHPLDEDETARVIASALRLNRAPTSEFRRAVFERCGGNPLFTEEVLRALVERGDLRYEEGAWRRTKAVSQIELPLSVRAAFEQRLQQLPATSLRVLQIAAVIGSRFTFDLLSEVASAEEDQLIASLRDGIEAQLLVEDDSREEVYRFRHALTREAVLSDLLARERRRVHKAVAEAIERRAGAKPERSAEELAYHYDEAHDVGRAVHYHEIAAVQAAAAGGYRRQADHLARAVEIAPEDHALLGDMHVAYARVLTWLGESASAQSAAAAALRLFEEKGDVAGQGRALLALARAIGVGQMSRVRELREEAVRRLEPLGPSGDLAHAYFARAADAVISHDPQGRDLMDKVAEMAAAFGEREIQIRALNLGGIARGREGLPMVRESLRLALEVVHPELIRHAYHNLWTVMQTTGDPYAEVRRIRDDHLTHARRYGLLPAIRWLTALAARDDREWDRAREVDPDETGIDADFPDRFLRDAFVGTVVDGPSRGLRLVQAAWERGVSAGRGQEVQNATLFAGEAYLAAGQADEALKATSPALDIQLPPWAPFPSLPAICAAIEVGDGKALTRWTTLALRTPLWPDDHARITSALARGALAEVSGDAETALREYELSALAAEDWRFHFTATQARLRRAKLLAEKGDSGGARTEFEAILAPWVRAPWYLGELEKRARAMGIELVAAGG